jgi:flagellar hook-basal body complex protein FliE
MRLDPLKSTLDTSINPDKTSKKTGLAFVDAFQEAVKKVNTDLSEADKAGLDMSSGKNANIHEVMLQMQKANIQMSLMVTTVNKMIEAYNQLMTLR